MSYKYLFSPIKIGEHTYKNRIVASPIYCGPFINIPGLSDVMVNAMKARARGGAAQVTVGETPVNFNGANKDPFEPIDFLDYQSETSKKYKSLTDYIHAQDSFAMIEISHCGESREVISGATEAFGPMGYTREDGLKVIAMDEAMMQKTVEEFVVAAKYMKAVGFDGVMIHAGHGWLLHQFLSPRTNHRTDAYGGSLENRMRFPIQVIKRVREALGKDFILEMRISGDEHMENGMELDETIEFCKTVEPYIDIIHMSVGVYRNPILSGQFSSIFHPHGLNADMASEVKKAVDIPVTVVGGINNPEFSDQLIADGKCDMVAMARQLTADAEFPNKAKAGKADDINPCIRCYKCFPGLIEGVMDDLTKLFGCSVNPKEFFYDEAFLNTKPKASRKVLVVGGGVAGMQAAIMAHDRGHQVTLVEAAEKLGGLLNFTDYDSFKLDLKAFKDLLIRRIEERDIKVIYNTKVTKDNVLSFEPDAVILAVGSEPNYPAIEGIELATHAIDVYGHEADIGKSVLVIGGGLVGCEVGLHLAEKGHEVNVIEMQKEVAPDSYPMHRVAMIDKMNKLLKYQTGLACTQIEKDGVVVMDEANDRQKLNADSVIFALGMHANNESVNEIKKASDFDNIEVYEIGDCTKPAKVYDACRQAFIAAYSIL